MSRTVSKASIFRTRLFQMVTSPAAVRSADRQRTSNLPWKATTLLTCSWSPRLQASLRVACRLPTQPLPTPPDRLLQEQRLERPAPQLTPVEPTRSTTSLAKPHTT